MKAYAYFPGCSLEKMALSYHQSALESARRLDLEFRELDDWNCCGTTAYFAIDQLLSYTLSARNLALAEKLKLDMVAPCAGCYKNAYFTNVYLKHDADLAEHVNEALKEDDLQYSGTIQVYHLLEVFCQRRGRGGNQKARHAVVERPASCAVLWLPDRPAAQRSRGSGKSSLL